MPDCLVRGYEPLIDGLDFPDPDDRHVLAAAIRSGSEVIVTENTRDFPPHAIEPYDIETQTPDVFVLHLVDLAPAVVSTVIHQQANALTNPPMTAGQLLDHLAASGLQRSVAAIRHL